MYNFSKILKGVHKVSFSLFPQLIKHLLREATVCTWYSNDDARTSGTSRLLTVASLQWFKMEALFPASVHCEERSVIKFLSRAHSPTFLSLHLRHNSFSNPSVALPTSQFILQPFRCFTYVTAHSPTLLSLQRHRLFTYVIWRAVHDKQ